jgi:hypothetical protein
MDEEEKRREEKEILAHRRNRLDNADVPRLVAIFGVCGFYQ